LKKIIILIFILKSIVFSSDDLNQTSLDMFLFKIGFTSLASEVKEQRKILDTNTLAIQKLQKQLALLSDTNSKNKLSSSLSLNNSNNKNTIDTLNKKIILLQSRLTHVLNDKMINKLSKPQPIIKEKKVIKQKIKKPKKIKKQITKSKFIKKLPYKYAKVNYNNLKVHNGPSSSAKITKLLDKNTLIKIEYCNKYLWCKIYNENSYVAKIRLKF